VYVGLKNFAFLEPYLYPLHMAQAGAVDAGARLYGPYADAGTLDGLKRRGFKTVVSLLDPDLIYEKSLIEREMKDSAALGLTYYNFPMRSDDPADSPRNAAAVEGIRRLIQREPKARFYIHCYLGKHRSMMVMEALGKDR
ncbi:MAG: hypothetical protein RLZZ200_646, partial [Pseudomonadota bacterium]